MKDFIRYILKENLPKKGIVIKEGVEISEGLKYHKEYDLPLVENVFIPFSDEFFLLINEKSRESGRNPYGVIIIIFVVNIIYFQTVI